jgi:hypothetical protein
MRKNFNFVIQCQDFDEQFPELFRFLLYLKDQQLIPDILYIFLLDKQRNIIFKQCASYAFY